MTAIPPKRKAGQGTGRRRMDGEMLDFCSVASVFGGTEKQWRGWADRGLIPYHRLGGRIFFLRGELCNFLSSLPGNNPDEARANIEAREGRAASCE